MPYQNKIRNFRASLSLFLNSGGWISPRRLELLAAIGRTNSISNGAKAVGMTYRGAWVAVEEMNNLAGVPLIKSWQEGHGGGGAELTEIGKQLVVELSCLSALQTQLFQSVAVFNEFD